MYTCIRVCVCNSWLGLYTQRGRERREWNKTREILVPFEDGLYHTLTLTLWYVRILCDWLSLSLSHTNTQKRTDTHPQKVIWWLCVRRIGWWSTYLDILHSIYIGAGAMSVMVVFTQRICTYMQMQIIKCFLYREREGEKEREKMRWWQRREREREFYSYYYTYICCCAGSMCVCVQFMKVRASRLRWQSKIQRISSLASLSLMFSLVDERVCMCVCKLEEISHVYSGLPSPPGFNSILSLSFLYSYGKVDGLDSLEGGRLK